MIQGLRPLGEPIRRVILTICWRHRQSISTYLKSLRVSANLSKYNIIVSTKVFDRGPLTLPHMSQIFLNISYLYPVTPIFIEV